jgi:hypothetical protein
MDIIPTGKEAIDRLQAARGKGCDGFLQHFSESFVAELEGTNDREYWYLICQLLQPSFGSPVNYSDELWVALEPIEAAYIKAYDDINHVVNGE